METRSLIASRVSELSYAIRELVPLAKQLEKQGEKIIYLNIGDPLKYDFDTPRHIKDALYEAALKGLNYYSRSEGENELREAIAEKEKKINGVDITSEDVVVTHGVSEAIQLVCATLIDPGDEVLLPEPTYPLYIGYVKMFGGKPIFYRCAEENGWMPDLSDLRKKISSRTKFIVVINPNNPTGSLYSEKCLRSILDIAAEFSLPVVSDEIYDRIVFEGKFRSLGSFTSDVPVIGLNGFSKTYLMTGWRLGYLYVVDADEERKESLLKAILKVARCRLGVTTPVQYAGVAALRGPQDHIKAMVDKLIKRRDYALKRLRELTGITVVKPNAAFYLFPMLPKETKEKFENDKDFATKLLLEEKVLVVHGSGFGPAGSWHIRIVFLPSISILEEAFNRIETFLKKYNII